MEDAVVPLLCQNPIRTSPPKAENTSAELFVHFMEKEAVTRTAQSNLPI
jgi:hypothetical protein